MQSPPVENIQTLFLENVRQLLPKNLSFADELASLLDVSRDSIYRRIRGETILSLTEVKKICTHYKVSIDSLISPSTEVISFTKRSIDPLKFTLEMWFNSISSNLELLASFPEKEVIYSAKDIPPCYYFKFTDLARFKLFFWMKSYQRDPSLEKASYNPDLVSPQLLVAGEKLWRKYSQIPSTEIWSDETFNVTIRQVEFYYDNGFIKRDQAHGLLDEYLLMINDIRQSASKGKKDGFGLFNLYRNEFLISDTTFLFKMGDRRMAFITYNTMNILNTAQVSFCQETEEYLSNIINKSSLISTTGERERNKFFNQVESRIQGSKDLMR